MDAAVDQPDHIARTRSLPDAVILARAEILSGKARRRRRQRVVGAAEELEQLGGRRRARNIDRAEGVYCALQQHGADRRDGELQTDRNAHPEQTERLRPAEFPVVLLHPQHVKVLFHIPDAEHTRDRLRHDRCNGRARNAHFQAIDGRKVQYNVDKRCQRQEPDRRLAVAQRTQHARPHIVKDGRRNAAENDENIVKGVFKLLRRRSHRRQHRPARRKRQRQQQRRCNRRKPDAVADVPAQRPIVARTEGLRNWDRHTGTQAAAEADYEKIYGGGRADAAQRHHAQRVADDRGIDKRVDLLEQQAKQNGDRKLQYGFQRTSAGKISCHNAPLLSARYIYNTFFPVVNRFFVNFIFLTFCTRIAPFLCGSR